MEPTGLTAGDLGLGRGEEGDHMPPVQGRGEIAVAVAEAEPAGWTPREARLGYRAVTWTRAQELLTYPFGFHR